MKRKIILIILSTLFLSCLYAENVKIVKTRTAGTLASRISESKWSKITNLTVIGPINSQDIAFLKETMKESKSLHNIDLRTSNRHYQYKRSRIYWMQQFM
jgi:ribosomal protein S28E/S33